jgi:glycosyltransferase involved in cell wall biosynthesis
VSVRSITATAETLEDVADGAPVPTVIADLARALDSLPPERRRLPLLVSVGRLHPVKGMDRFASAWASYPWLRDRFNAVIIGGRLDVPDRDEAAVLAAVDKHRMPTSGLILLGNRPHRDALLIPRAAADGVACLIPGAGVYVCASAKEEFGLAVPEAIASGLRVVAPAHGGPPTYIADKVTGLVCDTGSVKELAKAILRASELPLDTDEVRQARNHIAEDITLERTAADLIAVYQATIEKQAA